ncbi:type II toxin-antitoxin system Phd/YefM family antitoxin [Affinirhizobium pseudoryzae]|uniref:type II toxin-antitoxin system Phd/YefM family antitoxin n=1 Tax=Allorhizobium pseudoryzae TaxID=379684 RepID=UPI0013EBE5A0|nr:type II toxin-antitoxin system Phd/YefM family antitoxin [Allorhizobium pseudoryzae]
MTVIRISRADSELSKLIDRVEAGEEIVLARDDAPVAKLVAVEDQQPQPVRGYGRLAHLRDKIPADLFLEPMSQDELDAWEGKYSHPADNGQ